MSQKKKTAEELKVELSEVAADMVNIMQCLEVLENSLYFSSERTDKDITKPCAAAACMILNMLDSCQEKISDISFEM